MGMRERELFEVRGDTDAKIGAPAGKFRFVRRAFNQQIIRETVSRFLWALGGGEAFSLAPRRQRFVRR